MQLSRPILNLDVSEKLDDFAASRSLFQVRFLKKRCVCCATREGSKTPPECSPPLPAVSPPAGKAAGTLVLAIARWQRRGGPL